MTAVETIAVTAVIVATATQEKVEWSAVTNAWSSEEDSAVPVRRNHEPPDKKLEVSSMNGAAPARIHIAVKPTARTCGPR